MLEEFLEVPMFNFYEAQLMLKSNSLSDNLKFL